MSKLKVGIGVGLVTMILGAVVMASGGLELIGGRNVPKPTPMAVKQGNSGKYLYAITDTARPNTKRVQFDPALPTDDAVVVEALKAVAKDGFGVVVDESIPPVVETINETNDVTFTEGQVKMLFELFRNSSGGVGMAEFSKVQLP